MSARYDTAPNCPIWIKNRKYRPSEYIRMYEELKDKITGTVQGDKVTALLFKSGLHPQQLAHIWLLLNNKSGVLSEQEFVIVLALIGLVQKGAQIKDLNSLFRIGMPPVPDLSKGSSFNQTSTTDGDGTSGDCDDDDEFSDFQSAVVQTQPPQTMNQPQTTTSGFKSFGLLDDIIITPLKPNTNINNPQSYSQTQPQGAPVPIPKYGGFQSINLNNNNNINIPFPTAPVPNPHPQMFQATSFPNVIQKSPAPVPLLQVSSIPLKNENYNQHQRNLQPPTIKPQTKNTDSLLIGDEDKYSALRDLMELDGVFKKESTSTVTPVNTNKLIGQPSFQNPGPNTIQPQSLEYSANSGASDGDFDFGDFQSFSNAGPSSLPVTPAQLPTPFNFNAQSKPLQPVQKSLNNLLDKSHSPKIAPNSQPQSMIPATTTSKNDNWNDGDADCDYGDFVSSYKSEHIEKPAPGPAPVSIPPPESKTQDLLFDIFSNISLNSSQSEKQHSKTTNVDNMNSLNSLLDLDLNSFSISSPSAVPASSNGAIPANSFQIPNNPLKTLNLNFSNSIQPMPLKTTLIGTREPEPEPVAFGLGLDLTDNEIESDTDPDSYGDFTTSNSIKRNSVDFGSDAQLKSNNAPLSSITISLDPEPTSFLEERESPKVKQRLQKRSSPETISIASLELGSYSGSGWDNLDALRTSSGNSPLPGINMDSEVKTKERDTAVSNGNSAKQDRETETEIDKYSCFRMKSEESKLQEPIDISEKLSSDWKRILEVCIKLIKQAQTILNKSSLDSELIKEVLSSAKGSEYLLDLREINMVACRIYYSWMKIGGTEVLGELHQRLALAWDSLVPFVSGSTLETEFKKKFKPEEMLNPNRDDEICCICLLGTINNKPDFSLEEELLSMLLDFNGKLYHLPCANLWLNEIDSTLPM